MSEQQEQQEQQRTEALATELKNVRETTTKEIAELRKRVTELEDELDRREQNGLSAAGHAGMFDKHDAAVLDALDGHDGEVFVGTDIIDLYRQHSGIRRQRTLKRRAKDLFRSPVFEMIQNGRGRFVGSGGGMSDE